MLSDPLVPEFIETPAVTIIPNFKLLFTDYKKQH